MFGGGGSRGPGRGRGGGGGGGGGGGVGDSRSNASYGRVRMTDEEEEEERRQGGPAGFDRHMHEQRLKIKEQDRSLEMLATSVERLGDVSLEISEQIDEQNTMLDEMDQDLDTAQNTIDMVTKQTEELVKRSGGIKWFAFIVCLSVVLFILVLLVLFT